MTLLSLIAYVTTKNTAKYPIGYNKQMARKQYVKDDDTKHMSEKGS